MNIDGTTDGSTAFDWACLLVGLLCSCDPSEDSPVLASLSKFNLPFGTAAAMRPFSASWKVNYEPSKTGHYLESKGNFKI